MIILFFLRDGLTRLTADKSYCMNCEINVDINLHLVYCSRLGIISFLPLTIINIFFSPTNYVLAYLYLNTVSRIYPARPLRLRHVLLFPFLSWV